MDIGRHREAVFFFVFFSLVLPSTLYVTTTARYFGAFR